MRSKKPDSTISYYHKGIKIECVNELKKRYKNRERTLHRDILCLCIITHTHSYSKYVSITPISKRHQCAV